MRKHCCRHFQIAVKEKFIMKAIGYDETEWFFNKGFHLYYCPFCGTNIKGKGWGEYDIEAKINRERKT